MEVLEKKMISREARICVVGLGYTGLPLALSFVENGYQVLGVDTNKNKIADLKKGISYDVDISQEYLGKILESERLKLSARPVYTEDIDCFIVCVPTPLNKTKDPDISYILDVTEKLSSVITKDTLIVLQSTTYPGTTRELILPIIEKSGLKAGTDFYLSFSPERLDPGNKVHNTKNIPRIVGGITEKCTSFTKMLFETVVDEVVTVSSADTAEMTKLLENTFRSVNIAMINEMAIMSDKLGLDIWEVINAASTKPFGFTPFYPGPGIGGHCIPVDPHYLSWKLKLLNYKARFVELASEINSEMPEFIVQKVSALLNKYKKSVNGSRILVAGVTYKKDIDDHRESPALDIIGIFSDMQADIKYSDPFVEELIIREKKLKSVSLTQKSLAKQDIVIILTDHSSFDYEMIYDHSNLIFDTRNVYKKARNKKIYTL
ncbi:MAG: nucleotide sugar dehydrogenase [bacterium]|nr:nucleotide sugar dehydrogenase [bacterium]